MFSILRKLIVFLLLHIRGGEEKLFCRMLSPYFLKRCLSDQLPPPASFSVIVCPYYTTRVALHFCLRPSRVLIIIYCMIFMAMRIIMCVLRKCTEKREEDEGEYEVQDLSDHHHPPVHHRKEEFLSIVQIAAASF